MRYTCVEDGSRKFWEGSVAGSILTVRFGRIGTDGQSKDKDLGSPENAERELAKLIREKTGKGYVADADGAGEKAGADEKATAKAATAPKTPAGAAEKPAGPDGKYLFLFYGANPDDWAEGANGGHVFDLRFVEAPSAATRLEIAETFERAAYKSVVDPDGDAWRWAGAWVFVTVGESDSGEGHFFGGMQKLLKTLHETVPLAEVIYWGVREWSSYSDKWTKWSISQQPKPTPEPAWAGAEPVSEFGQTTDASLSKGEVDQSVEERRKKTRLQLEIGTAPLPAGKIGMASVDKKTAPRPAQIPAAVKTLFEDCGLLTSREGCVVAINRSDDKVYYLNAKGERKAAEAKGRAGKLVISADGKRAFFGTQPSYFADDRTTRIYRLSLPDGQCDEIFNFPVVDEYACAVPVGEDRIVILIQENLMLASIGGGEQFDILHPVDGYSLTSARDGKVVFVHTTANTKPVLVYRTDGGTLKKLGAIGPSFLETWEIGDRIFAGNPFDPEMNVFEILNVDDALAKKAGK